MLQIVKTFIHLTNTIKQPKSHQRHVITLVDDILQVWNTMIGLYCIISVTANS